MGSEYERCPLSGTSPHISPVQIPETCMRLCGDLMEAAHQGKPVGPYDLINPEAHADCGQWADVETGQETLQVDARNPSKRLYTILDSCGTCGGDVGSDSYGFRCPYSD